MAKHRRKPWLASVLLFYPSSMIYLQRCAFLHVPIMAHLLSKMYPSVSTFSLPLHDDAARFLYSVRCRRSGISVLRCELCHAAWAEEQLFHAHFLRMVFMPNIIPYCMNKDQCLELLVMRFCKSVGSIPMAGVINFFGYIQFLVQSQRNQRPGDRGAEMVYAIFRLIRREP